MLKVHYPDLFKDQPAEHARALAFAARVHELTGFLVDVRGLRVVDSKFAGRVTYHDACAGLRELKIAHQPRQLLAATPGVDLVEMAEREACCGFGGTFCVKYPEISTAMVDKKCAAIADTRADTLLAGDLGCLMNMAGIL